MSRWRTISSSRKTWAASIIAFGAVTNAKPLKSNASSSGSAATKIAHAANIAQWRRKPISCAIRHTISRANRASRAAVDFPAALGVMFKCACCRNARGHRTPHRIRITARTTVRPAVRLMAVRPAVSAAVRRAAAVRVHRGEWHIQNRIRTWNRLVVLHMSTHVRRIRKKQHDL